MTIKVKTPDRLYRYESILRELYVNQGLSIRDVADRLDCNKNTVVKYLNNHEIETRDKNPNKKPVSYYIKKDRSNRFFTWYTQIDGEKFMVYEHRLLAVSKFGFDSVKDKVVHHKNHMQLDNRPENIELMTESEHSKYHQNHEGFKNE